MGTPHGVVANMLDCNIVENKFKLQLGDYVCFQKNTIWKGMNGLVL